MQKNPGCESFPAALKLLAVLMFSPFVKDRGIMNSIFKIKKCRHRAAKQFTLDRSSLTELHVII